MPRNYGVTTLETSSVDNLLYGPFEAVDVPGTIASGAGVLTRGTVLGKVTASGKYIAYTSGAADGSQNPVAVLAVNVDATSEDVPTCFYIKGVFNKKGLVGADANAIDKLAARGVIVKEGRD